MHSERNDFQDYTNCVRNCAECIVDGMIFLSNEFVIKANESCLPGNYTDVGNYAKCIADGILLDNVIVTEVNGNLT